MSALMATIATTLGYVVNFIYGLVNNYGLAIIIFTLIFKIIMIPISINQQKTMKKNGIIQVKSKEIQEKYANDQVRQSEELMKLYKEEHMSPFGGCLTSIIQMIIFLSVFYLVSSPLTYVKKVDNDIIETYVNQLKEESGDSQIKYKEIAVIKNFGSTDERININMDFLGMNLCNTVVDDLRSDWKVIIIPALYIITSLVNMKILTNMNPNSVKKDEKTKDNENKEKDEEAMEAMQDMSKSMTMMMPVLTVMIACIAPLGLALYWLVSNLFTLIEKLIMNKISKNKEENEEAVA